MKGQKRKGFTLIECWWSLPLLRFSRACSSLLLPALVKAKEKAFQARCRGNLRQIGLGLLMYVQERERYPDAFTLLDNPTNFFDWDKLIEPYTQSNWTNALYK